jgi:hypothetical protein
LEEEDKTCLENDTFVGIYFNNGGYDYFDIDLLNGFGPPVNISSNKGKSLVCLDRNCPDNVEKTWKLAQVPIDGIFDINYCPEKIGAFGGKKLELVEASHVETSRKLSRGKDSRNAKLRALGLNRKL